MKQLAAGSAITILALATWFYAGTFPHLPEGYPGPSLFPRVIAFGMFFAGLVLLFQAIRTFERSTIQPILSAERLAGVFRIGLVIIAIALYPLLRDLIGFIPLLSIIGLLVGVLLRAHLLWAAIASVAGSVLIYSLFTNLLGVPL